MCSNAVSILELSVKSSAHITSMCGGSGNQALKGALES
jgi:hypothetical protein